MHIHVMRFTGMVYQALIAKTSTPVSFAVLLSSIHDDKGNHFCPAPLETIPQVFAAAHVFHQGCLHLGTCSQLVQYLPLNKTRK